MVFIDCCWPTFTYYSDKDDAETRCKEYIAKATDMDETNPASWQSLASLNLIKNEKEAAKESIEKSLNLWLPSALAIISTVDSDHCTNDILVRRYIATDNQR